MIRRYTKADETALFQMLEEEGDEWSDYHGTEGRPRYVHVLDNCPVYVVYEDGVLCGYVRCREDGGFGVYVFDLLVKKEFRGRQLGRLLMEQACRDFPDQPVYVMSDIDPYYEKLGYCKIGSVFEVKI